MDLASKCPIEVFLEVRRHDCVLENVLAGVDCQIERLAVRENTVLHRVTPNNGEDIEAILRSKKFETRRTRNGAVWVESSSCRACQFFPSMPFMEVLGTASLHRNRLMVNALLPSLSSLRVLKRKLTEKGMDFQIAEVKPFSHMEMTRRERETLEFALKRRYFDCENRNTLSDIAEQMGVSKSSLSETLRRGTKKAVLYYLSAHE